MRAPLRFAIAILALGLEARAGAQTLDPAVANDLTLTVVASHLTVPSAARFLPDGRLLVIQQNCIFVVIPAGGGTAIAAGTLACDYNGAERGLLGLAIDPQFATTNRIYFYYSAMGVTAENKNHVAYTTIDPQTSLVDVAGRHDILTGIYGPRNHDGGGLEFGPDGNLYIGGRRHRVYCGCAPGLANNYFATCLSNMNEKIMRIDREGGIPASNPLVGVTSVPACGATSAFSTDGCQHEPVATSTAAPRPEIYIWGLRNPWRFSFDSQTGWLWIGDVGEVTYEEITISKMPGEHHGWPFREGTHGRDSSTCQMYTPVEHGACVDPVSIIRIAKDGAAPRASSAACSRITARGRRAIAVSTGSPITSSTPSGR